MSPRREMTGTFTSQVEAFEMTYALAAEERSWPSWLTGNPTWVRRIMDDHRVGPLAPQRSTWFLRGHSPGRVMALRDVDFRALYTPRA